MTETSKQSQTETVRMNPEIKARWVAWLRENRGRQGRGVLRRGTGADARFCCLGGLCEIAVADGVIEARIPYNSSICIYGDTVDISDIKLPRTVMEWAGLAENDPYVLPKAYSRLTLGYLNDQLRFNFNQIADIIDEQL